MMKELNRKLAKWVGFTSLDPDAEWGMWTLWEIPDPKTLIQKRIGMGKLNAGLNFTNSLDACFKWLAPNHNISSIEFIYLDDDVLCRITTVVDDQFEGLAPIGQDALALCKAIEKLINSEELKR